MTKDKLQVYLSGSIRKGIEDTRPDDFFWTDGDVSLVRSLTGDRIEFMNPALTKIDRSDTRLNFGCDLYLVSISDLVLVDLRRKKGIGVGAELMMADSRKIPAIGVLGSSSEYQRQAIKGLAGQDINDWTHPFAEGLCDGIFERLEDACIFLNRFIDANNVSEIYREKVHSAIDYFLSASGAAVQFHD